MITIVKIKKQTLKVFCVSFVFGLGVMVLTGIGCGQGGVTGLNSAEAKAFENASPEVKQVWENALAADRTRDYANGQKLFASLAQMPLDDLQKQALEKQHTAFDSRLMDAAKKGDPVAAKVIQETQQALRSARQNANSPNK